MRAQPGCSWLLVTFIHLCVRDYLQDVQDVTFFERIFEHRTEEIFSDLR